ncbi:MAG: type II toxin-antitoxin system RelE/ParE family toxin [Halanaerobiales bacterium]
MSEDKYQINYLPAARKDLDTIITYIQTDNPEAALDLLNEIDQSVSQLASFPLKGKIPDDDYLQSKGYRMLIIGNYIVFYVVFEDKREVEIRRIIHGRRKYKFLL